MVFSGRTDEDEFIDRSTEEAEEKWKRIMEIDGGRNEHDKTARAKGVLEGSRKAAFICG